MRWLFWVPKRKVNLIDKNENFTLKSCLTHISAGHRQAVQNQIRRRETRGLIRLSTTCLQKGILSLNKNEKYHPINLKLEMDTSY